jgi:hypothetical protein
MSSLFYGRRSLYHLGEFSSVKLQPYAPGIKLTLPHKKFLSQCLRILFFSRLECYERGKLVIYLQKYNKAIKIKEKVTL